MNKIGNAITGDSNHLYKQLKNSMERADRIDIIVSFLMESGVKLILPDLKEAQKRGAAIRILTGNYLQITQPSALYLLRKELGDELDLRFYSESRRSFHPKAYLFHYVEDEKEYNEMYIGSSNISYSALTSAIEWNFRFHQEENPGAYGEFQQAFEQLFEEKATQVTEDVLWEYARRWKQPNAMKDLRKYEQEVIQPVLDKPEPRGAQIEALYQLENTRKEGFEKALAVLPTGTGKTLLAAFDTKGFQKILFVAHREEILKQAKKSFQWVYGSEKTYGDFSGDLKETREDIIFAQVQTLGKDEYLNEQWFAPDAFDYIVVDEFHHAAANQYRRIIEYFKPEFLLGITATPERLDRQNVFALCDYNVVYEVRLPEAINKGWLVPFRYYGIYDVHVDYDTISWKNGKYDEKELEQSLMIHKRQETILRHYLKHRSSRALGFCVSTEHADRMAEYFNSRGIKAAAVHSKPSSMNREEALQELEDGKLKILFSVDMFNEGLDVKSVDMVMFLRPTESPTVFLQQLGRGLRTVEGKEYLTVLDFIGNYKKADLIPYLLTGKTSLSEARGSRNVLPQQEEYPDNCLIDFDLELIDLFQKMRAQEQTTAERIHSVFSEIMENLGHVPSRTELYENLYGDDLELFISKKKLSPFGNYLGYLDAHNLLTEDEKAFYNSEAAGFIEMIETTAMSKSYKMPLLLAFYHPEKIYGCVTEKMVYESFYQYYHTGRNKADMLQDKSTKNFEQWTEKEYLKLARQNPINFMLKTHGEWFCEKENCEMALHERLTPWLENPVFIRQMKDSIAYRTMDYYRKKFKSGKWAQLEEKKGE